MKKIKKIISGIIWTIAGLVLLLYVLLRIPAIQQMIGNQVSSALEDKLGTKVSVGRVDIGLLNRITVDDVLIYDQQQKKMLQASRIAAKIDLMPLTEGRISISSAQLFGLHAILYKQTADSKPNFQFVIDSLSTKKKEKTPLDLRIKSLVIRNGRVQYDQYDQPKTAGQLSPYHLDIRNISSHLMLNALTDDSLSFKLKKLTMQEQSGLDIRAMSMEINANKKKAVVEDFYLQLPHSEMTIDKLLATYHMKDGKLDKQSLHFAANLKHSEITPSDLTCLAPALKNFKNKIYIQTAVTGTTNSLAVNDLDISSQTGSIRLQANGTVNDLSHTPLWNAAVKNLHLSADGISFLTQNMEGRNVTIPKEIVRMGNISFKGNLSGHGKVFNGKGDLQTDAGNANLALALDGQEFQTSLKTTGINLQRILDNNRLGQLIADIQAHGKLGTSPVITAKGVVSRFDYNGYNFRDIHIDGTYQNGQYDGLLAINDPNGKIDFDGIISTHDNRYLVKANIQHFNPSAMNLTSQWKGRVFDMNITGDITGSTINNAKGTLDIRGFNMRGGKKDYTLDYLTVKTGYENQARMIELQSDFGTLSVNGQYEFKTLANSFTRLIALKLPTFPGLPKNMAPTHNNFTINADIYRSDWLNVFFNLPLTLTEQAHIEGVVNDKEHRMNVQIDAPAFTYDDKTYQDVHLLLDTPDDVLHANLKLKQINDKDTQIDINANAIAQNNLLTTQLAFNHHGKKPIRGEINADTQFYQAESGKNAAHIVFHPSDIAIGDTIWEIQPSDVIYSAGELNIDHFQINHNKQHIIIDGMATHDANDSVMIDLKDIDVSYILNFVNFHSVEFAGYATGKAYIKDIFTNPTAYAQLDVNNFRFQRGRMGTLHANANYNHRDGKINIDAVVEDEKPYGETIVKGYISPKDNYIDLAMNAHNTRIEFMEGFCGSFMHNVEAYANGQCRLYGDLRTITLEGEMTANGQLGIKPLNTTYTLKNAVITMLTDRMLFANDTIYDRNGNIGIVNGELRHRYLGRMTYDVNVVAKNLLAYDFKDYGNNTFYGTVYGTGSCDIHGKSGEITMNINVTPNAGSFIEYNAAKPDAITDNNFIHWRDMTPDTTATLKEITLQLPGIKKPEETKPASIPSDMRLNFLINATPDFTLRVLMDEASGDKIMLNGTGAISATYFNKGAFQMFGNYLVDHGTYTMTIQNVIKKIFQFQEGGTIVFGGDPYHATLELPAIYTVNGASLSDLQVGKSFTSNNIRVNCLMNITGTPEQPSVTFDLDLPTLSPDAQKMVRSLINSQEDMNQQVLYLLAIGRFYAPSGNNASNENGSQSQTSLAMSSLLSGTISQQINNVLSTVIKNANWNFGANISTGDEGWNNAEYEGILSGRLLHNRLLINGQFGYRDNMHTQNGSSFIGDFDIRYLIFPNGNLAIKVYNQTNDRYFTRNSLNTQGIGLILKKDFTSLSELFRWRKKKKSSSQP